MARANGLVIVPEEVKAVKEGETVQVIMLDWSEE
jgi:molybdopterin biosynthesis enzyme